MVWGPRDLGRAAEGLGRRGRDLDEVAQHPVRCSAQDGGSLLDYTEAESEFRTLLLVLAAVASGRARPSP